MIEIKLKRGWVFCVATAALFSIFGAAAENAIPAPSPEGLALLQAMRLTLAQNPAIQLQQSQVALSQGRFQSESGRFDAALTASASRAHEETPYLQRNRSLFQDSVTDTTKGGLGVTKLLRNGLELGVDLSVTQTENNVGRYLDYAPENRASVDFSVRIPLLKGAGTEAAAAGETAARIENDANQRDAQHAISQSVFNSATLYWSYLAAVRGLGIAREVETVAAKLLKDIEQLIAADELPAAERILAEASLADRAASRVAAEQTLDESRNALARAIGLPRNEALKLKLPTDDFPQPDGTAAIVEAALLEHAVKRRMDFLAMQTRTVASAALLEGARNNMQPQLDLTLSAGYAGLREEQGVSGFSGAFSDNLAGPNAWVGIKYNFPFNNNAARGGFFQQSALHDANLIRTRDLIEQIRTDIDTSLTLLMKSRQLLAESKKSTALYRAAMTNEQLKYQLGITTLMDVISASDRLLNARQALNSRSLSYANALVRLRFETATLIDWAEDGGPHLDMESLTTVPHLTRLGSNG